MTSRISKDDFVAANEELPRFADFAEERSWRGWSSVKSRARSKARLDKGTGSRIHSAPGARWQSRTETLATCCMGGRVG